MPIKNEMPIFMTGASGYLGGRITAALRNQFALILGTRNPKSLSAIPAYAGLPCVNFDMNQSQNFSSALKGVHTVLHLAAMNHQDCEANPEKAYEINVLGTRKLVQAALDAGVTRFIYLSTVHVYGSPLKGILTETSATEPGSVYARTHLEAEHEILKAHRAGKMQTVILRLANSLGPPVHTGINAWNLVSNDLCRQAVTEKRMSLKSSGLQERNFVSISFLIHALEKLLLVPKFIENPIFQVGSPENISIWELAQWIQKRCEVVLNNKPELHRPALTAADKPGPAFTFDGSKLADFAGVDSKTQLQSEIDATLQFCKEMCG